MSWRGIFTGALALIALQTAVSSNQAATRVGGMLSHVADLARRMIDPAVPAIPDRGAATAARESGGRPRPKAGGEKDDDDGGGFPRLPIPLPLPLPNL